jgi:hypothetical protein
MRKFIEIDGKRYAWRDILKLRKEQRDENPDRQLTLFELKVDARPTSQRTASGRYEEPLLFDPDDYPIRAA